MNRGTARRVLFLTWAAPGHLYPMVPLAQAFQAAGHDVRVAVPPTGLAAATQTGLSAVGIGTDVTMAEKARRPELAAWGRPGRWPVGWSSDLDLLAPDQRRVIRALYEKQTAVAEAMLGDLVPFGRWWRPDLIVHDVLALAGPVLAAVLGVPAVGHGWEVGSTLHSPTDLSNADPLPSYVELFARHGVDPAEPVAWIDPCPPALRLPDAPAVRRMDLRCVPFNGSGVHPDWLPHTGRRPRICLTAGVAGAKYRDPDGPDVFALTLAALARLDVEIALAPSGDLDETTLPANVRVVRGVPFRMLLPTCELVVHHGGAGTALAAIDAGVPQIVLPPAPICSEIGARVEHAGAGRVLDVDGADSAERLLALATRVPGDPEIRDAIARIQKEATAMPTPPALAERLARDWFS